MRDSWWGVGCIQKPSDPDSAAVTAQTRPHSLAACSAPATTMSDKPCMAEIENLDKSKRNKTETQEKNPLPSEETTEQRKQAGDSTSTAFLFYFF